MTLPLARLHRAQRGVTLIELLVSLAVFALFMLMIDAVFSSARTSSRKTEVAADVQQNARVATERVTREIRETSVVEVVYDNTTPGHSQIVFKSARLNEDNNKFCLYTRLTTGLGYDARCYTFAGGNITPPPYTSPEPIVPRGTYTPIWQRYVGYYVVDTPDGMHELRRVVGDLSQPTTVLNLGLLTGGDIIATMIESFDVGVSGGIVSVTLKAKGTEVVQGRAIPDQEILLPGQSMTRN